MIYYVAHGLMVAWSLGCVVLPLYAAWRLLTDRYDRELGMGLACLLLGLPLGCVGAMIPWAVEADMRSPVLVELKKGEWDCTSSHVVNSTTVVASGKTTTVVPTMRSVCDVYTRMGRGE